MIKQAMPCLRPEELFDGILAKIEQRKIPFWAHLDLTYRCNQKCIHCYCQDLSESFSSNRNEMTYEEVCGLLDELADMGSLHLTLSGGEVFLREDFFDIAFYAKKKHFALKIFSNGSLIDKEAARRLAHLSPLQVELSLYGVTADVHDYITQKEGSFRKLIEAVTLLKENNIRVELKSVILKNNFHQANNLQAFARQLGADDCRFTLEVSAKNDGSKDPLRYQVGEKQVYDFLSRDNQIQDQDVPLLLRDRPLEKPLCGTGVLGCYISPYADVYPCIMLLICMGNIREKSLREIWYSPSALRDELDCLKTYGDVPVCRQCEYVQSCKKCLGMAHLETGDIKKCYPMLKAFSKASSGDLHA